MASPPATAPFSKAVVNVMRKLYPEHLADKSWDNTGLLLEAPFDPLRRQMNSVLLTVDLTKAVADEAIERNDSIIVAYHKVYCPHTAIDAAPGGLGDWLADIVTGTPVKAPQPKEEKGTKEDEVKENGTSAKDSDEKDSPKEDGNALLAPKRPTYMLQHHPSQADIKEPDLKLDALPHTRHTIQPLNLPSHPNAGMGRIVRFKQPQPLLALIERIGRGLGNPKGFPIAIPQGASLDTIRVRSVGICAGSGGSLLSGLDDVDLLFTGELSHHEALAAIERGQSVIALFHSNTERGFLHSVLRAQLQDAVGEEWERVRKEERKRVGEGDEEWKEVLEDEEVNVEVSEVDRDPYGIMISKAEL
ncbi:MAG: hypothetical protein M1821_006687 [Bathelium mastoideum]|nr:MAG: hypothetical protein M1821_006687 [Bathelium mastoideum]